VTGQLTEDASLRSKHQPIRDASGFPHAWTYELGRYDRKCQCQIISKGELRVIAKYRRAAAKRFKRKSYGGLKRYRRFPRRARGGRGTAWRSGGYRKNMLFQKAAIERKFHYIPTADTQNTISVADTGHVVLLNAMAQGTSASQRIGNQILNKSITARIDYEHLAGTTEWTQMDFALLYDRQPNGALAGITAIYNAASCIGTFNETNKKRFVVLAYKRVSKSAWSATGTLNHNGPLRVTMFKKMSLPTMFSGPEGAIGNIKTGAILLAVRVNTLATLDWDILYQTKLTYTDV